MKLSQYYLNTLKNSPQEAQLTSHKLMLRANLINQLASGIYTWLPLGLRVLRKVENIVREEMDKAGTLELSMPMTQPAELWQESGRWQDYGPELLRFQDRHQRDFCLGPTHEEVISDMIRKEIHSYRQLPLKLYQIQTKFRDEIRPRFGVMRAREFLMKDAYSFHKDKQCLQQTYELMIQTYLNIFKRIGLDVRLVSAHSGSIGGDSSHEFHVLAESGEDTLAFSDQSNYCANVELAESVCNIERPAPIQTKQRAKTPGKHTIKQVSEYLSIPETQCVKLLLVQGAEHEAIALILRGDHQLNEKKAEKHPLIKNPLTFVEESVASKIFNCGFGSLGPIDVDIPVISDHYAYQLADFCCGANQENEHYIGVNWGRDLPEPNTYDLRIVETGDPSPDGKGILEIQRGIEIGHVFQLGKKYSSAMRLNVQDVNGKEFTPYMGCYGIGISRIVAASIEQNHDNQGIIWPSSIAPFLLHIIPLNAQQNLEIAELYEKIYTFCQLNNIETLVDDRHLSPGNKFADADLIGCPHRLVISEKNLKQRQIEYKPRGKFTAEFWQIDQWQQKISTLE